MNFNRVTPQRNNKFIIIIFLLFNHGFSYNDVIKHLIRVTILSTPASDVDEQ